MVLYRNTQQDLLDILKNLYFIPLTRFELLLPLLADRLALNALSYSDSCSFWCLCKFYSLVGKPLTMLIQSLCSYDLIIASSGPLLHHVSTTVFPFKLKRCLFIPCYFPYFVTGHYSKPSFIPH